MANYTKTIVCLANSRKPPSGRCIAGKEVLENGYGGWIRPISARQTAEVSEEERHYKNGQDPRILDIIKVPMIGPAPSLHQTENHIIDDRYYWRKTGALSWTDLTYLLDNPDTLWPNGGSTFYGRNDRVKIEVAAKLKESLLLIKPEALTVGVQMEGGSFQIQDGECELISSIGGRDTSSLSQTQLPSASFLLSTTATTR